MKIGDLSRETGVAVRLLRYYESQGLLTSERTEGGHHLFPPRLRPLSPGWPTWLRPSGDGTRHGPPLCRPERLPPRRNRER
ncbi:MerR family DNA-binding transcriptional regulator [Actinomadura nitritigenes]|uniref:MerR family DNA-binding transcriptional regulator n=1 Tax=Actinomadura nitritigenes TaxID=134602 RepID=UPI003D8E5888